MHAAGNQVHAYILQCASLPTRTLKKKDHYAAFHRRTEMMIPYKNHKYKPPDVQKIKRNYWQPWNEKGKVKKKNYSYLGKYCLQSDHSDGYVWF